jgi:glucose 1-dehydrogenase
LIGAIAVAVRKLQLSMEENIRHPRSSASSQLPLDGQPALVTGANSGIGRAIALSLAGAGADIAINYLENENAAHSLASEIEAMGRRAIILKADVGNEGDVIGMFESVIGMFGTIHILVNNAGLQADANIAEMSFRQWKLVLDTNLTGQFLCVREAAREFRRRGIVQNISNAAGKIICISSVHQHLAWGGHANYAASKGGVMMLMKSAAQELAPDRIRVNAIAPGAIRTPINRPAWATPEASERLRSMIPYGRIGEAEDIAQAATWLVSDAADYVTGTTLVIDGGLSLNLQRPD